MSTAAIGSRRRPRIAPARILLYAFISLTALVWLVPIAGAIFASLRPFTETVRDGFFSWPHTLTLDNYANAWKQGDIPRKYLNTVVILVPALLFTLFFASMVAFVCSRFSWRFNILLLSIFTAGNLLPQQIIIQPLFQFYNHVELPGWLSNSGKLNGSVWGLILIHVAFQSGFCTFVLSNYMKLLPKSLNDAARIDGAGVWKQYWQIIMPLTLPALAALATLEFTWIYNDFFWGHRPRAAGSRPADHLVAGQPQRPVFHGRQSHRGGVDVRRATDPDRLLRAAAVLHRRIDHRRREGLTRRTRQVQPVGAADLPPRGLPGSGDWGKRW